MANRWGDSGNVADFIFLGSKITADGDCSHEIKRHLLLGRKVMTNLDSILKSRDITLSTKVCLVKAMILQVVMYGCESWTIKKASVQFSSVQLLSRVQLCNPMNHSTPSLPVHHQLPELLRLMTIELVMPSNHLILCRPLLLPPSIFPCIISNESVLRIRWPKY